jgi:hypothetical protein
MSYQIIINFQHPANTGVLSYLSKTSVWEQEGDRSVRKSVSTFAAGTLLPNGSPAAHPDPYYQLGAHPELVDRLWNEITLLLPRKCQWIINERPVLAHPSSGIIFGFAGGTHTYALRLPPTERQEALQKGVERVHVYSDGTNLDLSTLGEEWVFGNWFPEETRWCLAAYDFAD